VLTLDPVALAVDRDGAFAPDPGLAWRRPRPDFALPVAPDGTTVVDYANAALTLAFDRASWTFAFPGLALWNDVLGVERGLGFTFDLRAGTDQRPVMDNAVGKFGGALADTVGGVASWFGPPP